MSRIERACAWAMIVAIAVVATALPFVFLAGAFAVGTYYGELAYFHEVKAEREKALADYSKWLQGQIEKFKKEHEGRAPLNQYPEGTL